MDWFFMKIKSSTAQWTLTEKQNLLVQHLTRLDFLFQGAI
jgi:hypothetical protein